MDQLSLTFSELGSANKLTCSLISDRYCLNGMEAEKGETLKTVTLGANREYISAKNNIDHGSHIAARRHLSNMNYNGLGVGDARASSNSSNCSIKTC